MTAQIASRLVNDCLLHISKISGVKWEKAKYQSFLVHEFGRFRVWAHGFDPSPSQLDELDEGRGVVNDRLDEVLERSKYLKEPTIILLSSFAAFLLTKNFEGVGDDATRTRLENALHGAIEIYQHIDNDWCDIDSDQTKGSAMDELHDIVDSLFELASSLDDVFQNLQTPTDVRLQPVANSYKNLLRDKFPNARGDLILRFAEGNTKCHEELRSQPIEGLPVVGWEASADKSTTEKAQENSQDLVGPHPIVPSQVGSNARAVSFHDSGLGSSRPPTTRVSENAAVNDLYQAAPPKNVLAASLNDPGFGDSEPPAMLPSGKCLADYLAITPGSMSLARAEHVGDPGPRGSRLSALRTSGKASLYNLDPVMLSGVERNVGLHDTGTSSSHPLVMPASAKSPAKNPRSVRFVEIGGGDRAPPRHNPELSNLPPPRNFLPPAPALSIYTSFSLTSAMGNRPCTPRMPKSSGPGLGFKCSLCSRHQKSISNNAQWRKHIFSDLRPYMCTYDPCTTAKESFQSKSEWVAHQDSHISPGNDGLGVYSTCPFCLREIGPNKARFYSHVAHHMEDIRLLSLPPSHRQPEDLEDDLGLENSSDTSSRSVIRSELSIIAEEKPSGQSPGNIREQLREYPQFDKIKLVGDWLSGNSAGESGSASQTQQEEDDKDTSEQDVREITGRDKETYAMASQLHEQGRFGQALKWYRRALEGREMTLGEDHPDTLSAVHNIALVFGKQGKYEDALKWSGRVLVGRERALGKDHPDTLLAVHNMAFAFAEQGKYEDALELYRRALVGREKALGRDHLDTLTTVHNMATIFSEQGKYGDALEWYRRALGGREMALGKDHLDTLQTVYHIAFAFGEQGKYEDALEWYRRALAGRERALGKDHRDTLRAVHNMAVLFGEQGKYEDALEWYRRALVGRERALGKDHLDTLRTVHNMAAVFSEQGKYEDALELYRRALEGRERVLGRDHRDTLRAVHNMAVIFGEQGKYEDALEWYRRALAGRERALGRDHPDTLKTVHNMATIFGDQGKYGDALEWYRRVLAGSEKALGSDHPDTLKAVHNMATILGKQGKYNDALELYSRALAGREKALGKDHPLTKDTKVRMSRVRVRSAGDGEI